jgi:hypothetical protein
VDEEWEACKDIIQRAAEEIIGMEIPTSRNPWYDPECAKITAEKMGLIDRCNRDTEFITQS